MAAVVAGVTVLSGCGDNHKRARPMQEPTMGMRYEIVSCSSTSYARGLPEPQNAEQLQAELELMTSDPGRGWVRSCKPIP